MNSIWTIVPSIGILWVLDLEFRFLFFIFIFVCLNLQTQWFPVCSSLSVVVLLLCSLSLLGSVFSICFLGTSCFHWRFVFWCVSASSFLTVSPSFVIVSLDLLVFTCVFLFVKLCFHVLSRAALFTFGSWCLSFWIPVCSCVFGSVFHLSCFVCIGLFFVSFNNRFLSEHSASFILHLVLTSLLQLRKTSKCHPVDVF